MDEYFVVVVIVIFEFIMFVCVKKGLREYVMLFYIIDLLIVLGSVVEV